MKKLFLNLSALAIAAIITTPAIAQKEDKREKGDKDVQQVIVTKSGNKGEKITIEINGDDVKINGRPASEYEDKNKDVKVKVKKLKDMEALWPDAEAPHRNSWTYNFGGDDMEHEDGNRAMLGVTTDKVEEGAEINNVNKGSAAEKAGLQPGDIITKIDDKKVESPDDLSKIIKGHKPGDKVSVTYLRNTKQQKTTAELSKWKGTMFRSTAPSQNFDMDLGGMDIEKMLPKFEGLGGFPPFGQQWSWSGNGPKLGLSVQDTDDGKGVKVIEVDEESNAAKAGIKENDIITHIDDKAVNMVDEVTSLIREKKENPTVRLQITRDGKSQNIEVKMPRKIKTADL
jgi:serine protease Do